MRANLLLVVPLVALAACKKPEPASAPAAEPAPAPAPAPVVDDFREVDLSKRTRRAPARELSERWLIILDSEGDEEKRADRLKKRAIQIKENPSRPLQLRDEWKLFRHANTYSSSPDGVTLKSQCVQLVVTTGN